MTPMLLALLFAVGPLVQNAPDEAEVEARPEGVTISVEGACQGYTLFSPLRSKSVFLIDMAGAIVHRWETEVGPGNSVYLLDDGSLLRCGRVEGGTGFHGGGIGGSIQQFAWDGTLLWDYSLANSEWHAHHDVEPLPNGNVLVIAWERVEVSDAVALGRDPEHVSDEGFWPDVVFELEPARPDGAKIVWEWRAKDHLIQDVDDTLAGYGDIPLHPERVDVNADHRDEPPMTEAQRKELEEQLEAMRALGYVGGDEPDDDDGPRRRRKAGDWLHSNGIDYHPKHDLILLSVRTLDELWIIDHSTTTEEAKGSVGGRRGKGGDLLWRWGNPQTFGAGTPASQQLFAQHDAQWIPEGSPGAGNVLVFNNGRGRPGGDASSVDELVLPFGEAGFVRDEGQAFGPEAPIWTYPSGDQPTFYASFISGCQRLPNGNTLICSGPDGRVFEVTRAGEVVWEYWNPYGGEIGNKGPRGGPPRDGGPPAEEPRRRGGGPAPIALFRATRLMPEHPGLSRLGTATAPGSETD